MDYRRLGRTGLKVAQLCLGGMNFGNTCDEATSFAVMDAYVEAGGNFIDTADIYSRWAEGNRAGISEQIHRPLDEGARQPRQHGDRHEGARSDG